MNLEHQFDIPVPLDVVWAAFDDLEGLAPCMPGATLTSVDGDEFSGTVKVKLGPISMTYGGTGRFVQRDRDAGRVVVEARGKDKRGNGTAGATVTAQVTETDTGTHVTMSTDLTVTGKPAQFGRGVIQDVSDKLLGQFVECVTAKLQAGDATATPADDAAVSEPADGPAADSALASAGATPTPAHDTPPPAGGAPSGASAHSAQSAATPSAAPGGSASWPAPSAPHPAATPAPPAAELNLLSTVMPVLARRYAVPVLSVLAVIGVICLCRSGRRH